MRAPDLGALERPHDADLAGSDGLRTDRSAAACRGYSVIHSHCFISTKSFD
ncbi:hypothetical protein SAMN05421783_11379 [Thiocapsa roseopersicina]|uniref:Uncharacterized protein n=1 Tax=Thiocapsa roseopersicina TaxID=1058 RepID=A0A1H2YMD1_THIRO|nr:hypothetical protein SAMN05421783_11379 [Thiocapsa roseopersicina]